jgi:hypothetical protein
MARGAIDGAGGYHPITPPIERRHGPENRLHGPAPPTKPRHTGVKP